MLLGRGEGEGMEGWRDGGRWRLSSPSQGKETPDLRSELLCQLHRVERDRGRDRDRERVREKTREIGSQRERVKERNIERKKREIDIFGENKKDKWRPIEMTEKKVTVQHEGELRTGG